MKPDSVSSQVPAVKSRVGSYIRLLVILAVLAVIVIYIFPLVFKPRVDVPAKVEFGSPSSMQFQISNENLTPLVDVDYTCETSKLIRTDGAAVNDASSVIRGNIRKIPGRRAVLGRCQTGYILAAPLKSAEYKLTIKYKTYPWPQQRTSVQHITAELDRNGQVTGWKLE